MNRRAFLLGSAAVAVAAAAPALPLTRKLYEGAIGEYNGVIIREVEDIGAMPRLTVADILRAKRLMERNDLWFHRYDQRFLDAMRDG